MCLRISTFSQYKDFPHRIMVIGDILRIFVLKFTSSYFFSSSSDLHLGNNERDKTLQTVLGDIIPKLKIPVWDPFGKNGEFNFIMCCYNSRTCQGYMYNFSTWYICISNQGGGMNFPDTHLGWWVIFPKKI